jgi:ferredoxin-thioredoxin reductase catalytic subunit
MSNVTETEIREYYDRLRKDAQAGGYALNPNVKFTMDLVRGLVVNEKRYGYCACPCRLASGHKSNDLDIICPCDYRDIDLNDHGMCYCALYVTPGSSPNKSIPDRRLAPQGKPAEQPVGQSLTLSLPVWRCKVCGYLCAREQPPEFCPICKATKERFEKFI